MIVKNGILRRTLKLIVSIFVGIYIVTGIIPIIHWIIVGNNIDDIFANAFEIPNQLIKEE